MTPLVNVSVNFNLGGLILSSYSFQFFLAKISVSLRRTDCFVGTTKTETYSRLGHRDNSFLSLSSWKIGKG